MAAAASVHELPPVTMLRLVPPDEVGDAFGDAEKLLAQQRYTDAAAALHALWDRLQSLLIRENRLDLAEACFAFLPARARLDLLGYENPDVFAH